MTVTAISPLPAHTFAEHEHRDLVNGINRVHDVGCAIGRTAMPELRLQVLGVVRWIDGVLEPHIAWEEGWLYPEIDRRAGTPWATRAARFDHAQVRELVSRVRSEREALGTGPELDQHDELRCHLFGLEAMLRAHIEREERFLMPLLDELPGGPASS
jgi:hypothetical protein